MAYRAIDIAKIIVNDAIDIGHPITNLKLQKLLYYVQAAFLVEYNTPCFDDDIVAWKYGPVVERVYNDFRIYGSNIINNRITQLRTAEFNGERIVFKTVDIDSLNIPEKDATLILSIVNKFSFIKIFIDFFHNDICCFNTYPNINLVIKHLNAMIF